MTKYELTKNQKKELRSDGSVTITRNGRRIRVTPSMVKTRTGNNRANLLITRIKNLSYIDMHGGMHDHLRMDIYERFGYTKAEGKYSKVIYLTSPKRQPILIAEGVNEALKYARTHGLPVQNNNPIVEKLIKSGKINTKGIVFKSSF